MHRRAINDVNKYAVSGIRQMRHQAKSGAGMTVAVEAVSTIGNAVSL
jgi:hypothetical protein